MTYQYAFRKKAKERGLEPDECYCFGPLKKVPDIVITASGICSIEILNHY